MFKKYACQWLSLIVKFYLGFVLHSGPEMRISNTDLAVYSRRQNF